MKRILYFFVIASSFILVSCDVDSKQMEQYWKDYEAAKSEEVVEKQPEVITSTIIRVDRVICSGGYSSYSKTVILTDDGRSFSFRDSDNIGSVNVREGDMAQYLLYSDGKVELEGIAYAINK
jgi:hypothetical protein